MAFSMAAEIERDLILQRTKEALRFKKAQGIKLGRPIGPGKAHSIRNSRFSRFHSFLLCMSVFMFGGNPF
jgi:DNA invertase Pin-like site-specific DNA recombinase